MLGLGALSLVGALLHRVALLRVHVSFAHTAKAAQPLYAATFQYLLLGAAPPAPAVAALLLLGCGIALACAGEAAFSAPGLAALQGSAVSLALGSVVQKSLLAGERLSRAEVAWVVSFGAAALGSALWVATDAPAILSDPAAPAARHAALLAANATASVVQQFASLSVLGLVSPTAHSVVNAMKRVVVIAGGVLYFRNAITPRAAAGVAIAMAGAFLYDSAAGGRRDRKARGDEPGASPSPAPPVPYDAELGAAGQLTQPRSRTPPRAELLGGGGQPAQVRV